jgi:hypothetical protein
MTSGIIVAERKVAKKILDLAERNPYDEEEDEEFVNSPADSPKPHNVVIAKVSEW